MRRTVTLGLVGLLIASLSACGGDSSSNPPAKDGVTQDLNIQTDTTSPKDVPPRRASAQERVREQRRVLGRHDM